MLKAILNFFRPYKKEEPAVEVSTVGAGEVVTLTVQPEPEPQSTVEVVQTPVVEKAPEPKAEKPKRARTTTKKTAKPAAITSRPRKKK